MIPMNTIYNEMGIRETVLSFGKNIEKNLKDRFEKIDEIAEYNQLKVIKAMQDVLIMPADMVMMIRAEIHLKKYMRLFFTQKAHLCVRRSLAEHMLCHSHLRQI